VGYTLDEITNEITGCTPASFEPTIDYVVTKVPRDPWFLEQIRALVAAEERVRREGLPDDRQALPELKAPPGQPRRR
jgi:hypothetical protein